VAEWAFANGRQAGRRTDTLASAAGLYLPFVAAGQALGVLALFLPEGRVLSPDEQDLAEAFVNQAAVALKRSDLAGWIWPAEPAAGRPPLPSTARYTVAGVNA
jgi:two-component system sensor histidine kinase KdpD